MRTKFSPPWSDRAINIEYRPGSDYDAIKEVCERRCYRKPSIGVDVMEDEHWLDLGANIGAFAAYCFLRGATADCYEPEDSCFRLLTKNFGRVDGFTLHNTAVTAEKATTLPAWKNPDPTNNYRLTILPGAKSRSHGDYSATPPINNLYAKKLQKKWWDGIKCDIEGSELALIEENLMPLAPKLAMEYHFSRQGKDMAKFHHHMKLLRQHYEIVKYPPSLDKVKKGKYPGRFDIIVHCINP